MIRPIPGFPGYFAGAKGNIYSNRLFNDGKKHKLKPYTCLGYKRVRLCKNGIVYDRSIHFLVALTYIKGYKKGYEANHIDKNRSNNRVENLEWLTHRQNIQYSLCRKLLVITASGCKLYYPSCGAFAKATGINTSNLAKHYMQKKNGYIRRFNIQVKYLS